MHYFPPFALKHYKKDFAIKHIIFEYPFYLVSNFVYFPPNLLQRDMNNSYDRLGFSVISLL